MDGLTTVDVQSVLDSNPAVPPIVYDATTNKFYQVFEGDYSWLQANAEAQTQLLNGASGQLVTIRSAAENDIVQDLAQALSTPEDVWIGASDQNGEGAWHWYEDGVQDDSDLFFNGNGNLGGTAEPGAYTNWRTNEPTGLVNGPNEDYARLEHASGQWRDTDLSTSTFSYVVEWDAAEVLSSHTFDLTNDAGGRFEIHPVSGDITVANGALLDFEADMSHDVTVTVTDIDGNVSEEDFTIDVNDVNEAPTLDLDANDDSGATGTGFVTTFDGSPVTIADADTIITDPDLDPIQQVDVTITNLLDGADESLSVDTSAFAGINATYDAANGVLTITGDGTPAQYEAILSSVEYNNLSDSPDDTTRSISVEVDDGGVGAVSNTSIEFNLPISLELPASNIDENSADGTSVGFVVVNGSSFGNAASDTLDILVQTRRNAKAARRFNGLDR